MSWRDAPLYVQAFDATAWLLDRVATWQGPLATPVGDAARELVVAVSLALTFTAGRRAHLRRADEALVELRVLLRLAQVTGALSARQLRHISGQLDDVGRMIGGWRKRVDRPRAGDVTGDGPPAATGA